MAKLNIGEFEIAGVEIAKLEKAQVQATEIKGMLIIEGIRENGTKFRPSDWPERISSTFAVFGKDQRLRYAPGICPRIVNGEKVLAVEPSLKQHNPTAFQSVMKFARDNNLRTIEEMDSQE